MSIDAKTARYVNLASFRRDGREVRTPVWIAETERGEPVVYTNVNSGKVKRIRRNPRVRLAPCDMRGNVQGEWLDAKARIVEDAEQLEAGFRAMVKKYGWQMRLALLLSRLSGRYAERAILELEY